MHKPFTTLIFSLTLLSNSAPRAAAQVDAIPDPHQDFYQMRQPKRPVPQSISSDATDGKDVSDQNPIDLKRFHDQAQPKNNRAARAKAVIGGSATEASNKNGIDGSSSGTSNKSGIDGSPTGSSNKNGIRGSATGTANQGVAGVNNANNDSTGVSRSGNPNNDLNDTMTDVMPQSAPDFKNGQSSLINEQSVMPTAPVVTHPEVMPRPPIPTPPAVTLLPPLNGGRIKEDLAWRARAFKLRSESPDSKNGLVKGSRLVNANFEDTLAALTKVCSSANLTVDSVFESAGQILAHPSDAIPDKSRIIFSLKPVSHTSTLLRVGLDADNHVKQISFDDLLNRVETAANEKGLL